MRGLPRVLVVAVVAVAAVVLGWSLTSLLAGGSGPSGSVNRALIGGPFALIDQHGKPVTEQQFRGRLMLVYFGYTYCPDVCPTELQNMSAALDVLGEQAGKVQPLFVTVDPKRDTSAQLADYMEHFHKSFLGLTGTAEQVASAARAYRVYYARAKDTGKPGDPNDTTYLMDHSGYVYLMDKDGQYLTHFSPNSDPRKMAEKIRQYL